MLTSLLIAITIASASAASCSSYTTCADCIGQGSFCGWCSPAPTVYDNGTAGFQCQDQHEFGWHCNHLYSTDQCKQGYICDADAGTCKLAPAGQGDTKENCEKTCHQKPPAPSGLSKCNLKTLQCEPCQDYCTDNSDCKGSYCQNGLCHGSTCQTKTVCDEKCSGDTPDELVGTWRGVMIQSTYQSGEFDFKFQKRADGPQVMFRGPTGDVSTGNLEVDTATGGRDITIQYSAGPLNGTTYNGAYDPWEPSDETEQTAFYFGAPGDDKPDTIEAAMNGTGMTVYSMSRCSPKKAASCDFDSVFPSSTEAVGGNTRRLRGVVAGMKMSDPCSKYPSCSACIDATEGVCGWCSTKVAYNDSTIGTQCAGFDKTGQPLGWQCAGVFSKSDCADYGCDWTDIKNPKCKVCTGPGCGLSKTECSKACMAPPPLFKCNAGTKKCEPCANAYCTSDAQCPGSYCQISGAGPWSCHGGVAGGCATNSSCSAACNSTEKFYFCDKFAGMCKETTAHAPGAQSKWECEHACKKAAPTGTWRGIMVNKGFPRGEVDFTFYDDSTLHWRDTLGQEYKATIEGLNMTAGQTADMLVTGSVASTGKTFFGIFRIDAQGDDGLIDFLFWGESDAAAISDFDTAMAAPNRNFIMSGCHKGANCDFSSSVVSAKAGAELVQLTAVTR